MNNILKKGEVLNLLQKIEYADGGIVSKQILKNEAGNITLFSFDKSQMVNIQHLFDAMIQIIEGK